MFLKAVEHDGPIAESNMAEYLKYQQDNDDEIRLAFEVNAKHLADWGSTAADRIQDLFENHSNFSFDYSRVIPWAEQEAAGGSAAAAYMLAYLLEVGKGVDRNPQRAQELLNAAASQGYYRSKPPKGRRKTPTHSRH